MRSRVVPRLRVVTAIGLLLLLTGPAIVGASGRSEACSMCAERCCCKPPEGSGASGTCRLSRPCAAGEQKPVAPAVAWDPAVLDAAPPALAAPAASAARLAAYPPGPSDRTAAPSVPPPRT